MSRIYIIYIIIAILGIIGTTGITDAMVTYTSSDDDENNRDPQTKACYRLGYNDGDQNEPYNQTACSQYGLNDRVYNEGFISEYIVGQGMEYFTCNQIAKESHRKNYTTVFSLKFIFVLQINPWM